MELNHPVLALIWYFLLGSLLMGYCLLDGFDLGVGVLHLFLPHTEDEKRISINSIGPIWDGNEVWLVVFGGALFAMFPPVYASIFSGFYTTFILLLFALIFRAGALDFRNKVETAWAKKVWDYCFGGASFAATLLFGVAAGNLVGGVTLDAEGNILEGFVAQLNPFAVLVGVLVVILFSLHGASFLYFKLEGDFQKRTNGAIWHLFGVFMVLYMLTTMVVLVRFPHAIRNMEKFPILWVIPVLNVLALANIPRSLFFGRPVQVFLSSCACIVSFVCLLGTALFPYLVLDPASPGNSLTYLNGSSSERTLRIGLYFAVIGLPFVLVYLYLLYRTFRGKAPRELY